MTPPVEKHSQERSADTADLSTPLLRSSGRDDKGEDGASLSVVAEQEVFCVFSGGPNARSLSGRASVSACPGIRPAAHRQGGADPLRLPYLYAEKRSACSAPPASAGVPPPSLGSVFVPGGVIRGQSAGL
jgi:hypothetical protein